MANVSVNQVMQEWVRQGGPRQAAPAMARIARRESGLNVKANNAGLNKNGTVDHGLYQINDVWRKDPVIGPLFRSGAIYTLEGNTTAAIRILKVQGPQAWSTYNAGTDAKYLSGLKFGAAQPSGPSPPHVGNMPGASLNMQAAAQATGPAVTATGQTRQDLLKQYLLSRGQPGALLSLGAGIGSLQQPAAAAPISSPSPTIAASARPAATARAGKAPVRSSPINIINFDVLPVANQLGINVTPQSVREANARHGPTNTGGVSDHQGNGQDTWAADMSNGSQPTPQMDKLAAAIAKMYGIPWTGSGLVNHTVRLGAHNYRLQLIYRTSMGGNHYNHVHFGVKKLS